MNEDRLKVVETGHALWQGLCGGFPPHDTPYLEGDPQPTPDHPRRLALVLAYDGGEFAGWQVQPGLRTVQGELEAALSRLCAHPVRLVASGRTDAGVHAHGQVAGFATTSRLASARMLSGLRALCPPDILVRELGPVDHLFHARYSATAKTYHYWLWPQARPTPFLRRHLWPLAMDLDAAAMQEALAALPGPQDLRAFSTGAPEHGGPTLRTILEARLATDAHGPWRLTLTATGFLRHVVRNLAGSLVQVGQGRLKPHALAEMLAAGRRLHPGPKAPPGGLYLSRVYYGPWPGPDPGPEEVA